MDILEQLQQLTDAPASPAKGKAKRDNPLAGVSLADSTKATSGGARESMTAGQYERMSITLTPEMKAYIKSRVAPDLELSALETIRLLLAWGLQDYDEGRRPEYTEEVTRRRQRGVHWTDE